MEQIYFDFWQSNFEIKKKTNLTAV